MKFHNNSKLILQVSILSIVYFCIIFAQVYAKDSTQNDTIKKLETYGVSKADLSAIETEFQQQSKQITKTENNKNIIKDTHQFDDNNYAVGVATITETKWKDTLVNDETDDTDILPNQYTETKKSSITEKKGKDTLVNDEIEDNDDQANEDDEIEEAFTQENNRVARQELEDRKEADHYDEIDKDEEQDDDTNRSQLDITDEPDDFDDEEEREIRRREREDTRDAEAAMREEQKELQEEERERRRREREEKRDDEAAMRDEQKELQEEERERRRLERKDRREAEAAMRKEQKELQEEERERRRREREDSDPEGSEDEDHIKQRNRNRQDRTDDNDDFDDEDEERVITKNRRIIKNTTIENNVTNKDNYLDESGDDGDDSNKVINRNRTRNNNANDNGNTPSHKNRSRDIEDNYDPDDFYDDYDPDDFYDYYDPEDNWPNLRNRENVEVPQYPDNYYGNTPLGNYPGSPVQDYHNDYWPHNPYNKGAYPQRWNNAYYPNKFRNDYKDIDRDKDESPNNNTQNNKKTGTPNNKIEHQKKNKGAKKTQAPKTTAQAKCPVIYWPYMYYGFDLPKNCTNLFYYPAYYMAPSCAIPQTQCPSTKINTNNCCTQRQENKCLDEATKRRLEFEAEPFVRNKCKR